MFEDKIGFQQLDLDGDGKLKPEELTKQAKNSDPKIALGARVVLSLFRQIANLEPTATDKLQGAFGGSFSPPEKADLNRLNSLLSTDDKKLSAAEIKIKKLVKSAYNPEAALWNSAEEGDFSAAGQRLISSLSDLDKVLGAIALAKPNKLKELFSVEPDGGIKVSLPGKEPFTISRSELLSNQVTGNWIDVARLASGRISASSEIDLGAKLLSTSKKSERDDLQGFSDEHLRYVLGSPSYMVMLKDPSGNTAVVTEFQKGSSKVTLATETGKTMLTFDQLRENYNRLLQFQTY